MESNSLSKDHKSKLKNHVTMFMQSTDFPIAETTSETNQRGRHRSATMPIECGSDEQIHSYYHSDTAAVVLDGQAKRRLGASSESRKYRYHDLYGTEGDDDVSQDDDIRLAENVIEASRISNNYKFGFKKWKSRVTVRSTGPESEKVQDLDLDMTDAGASTCQPSNILYTILFGWWLSLVYVVVGTLMCLTVFGLPYARFCMRMAAYFFWPFGKFVHQIHRRNKTVLKLETAETNQPGMESQSLLSSDQTVKLEKNFCWNFWRRGRSYLWLLLAVPVLLVVHGLIWAISWFFVVSIPIAKLNSITMTKILYLPPDEIHVGDSSQTSIKKEDHLSEIILYTHHSINVHYYKYTIDGVNIILANLLIFVLLSIILGYAADERIIGGVTKCILSVLAIIPLTYYIGMAITSISAQSSFAVGAILNATFGSMVEVILFIIMLKKGRDTEQECYQELVKSSLTGAILCSILFIPGMSMIVGGFKYRTQRFNPKSANISASLLFVAIVGVFAPTIFSKIFGSLRCQGCEKLDSEIVTPAMVLTTPALDNNSVGFLCQHCEQSLNGLHGDRSLYTDHIEPLVFAISVILPLAYLIGLIFTMKTHSAHVFQEFEQQMKEQTGAHVAHHGSAQWSRLKSTLILLACAVAIALCADLISENIQPLLETTGISEYFIGVTVLSLVTELPEVVNGVQFALQNNVNLGIEIGCSTAIQVCLVQIPLLVLVNLIYPMSFYLVFNDVHLWTVIFSVVIINYIFQDGKSDYFQGSIVVFIYILLMCMYLFMITPDHAMCHSESNNTTLTSFS